MHPRNYAVSEANPARAAPALLCGSSFKSPPAFLAQNAVTICCFNPTVSTIAREPESERESTAVSEVSIDVGGNLAQTEVSSGGSDGPIASSGGGGGGSSREEFMEGTDAQKSAYVQAETKRVKRLPSASSSYNTNRLKMLDKMLHLLGKVRTSTEGDELEILFANLNF